MFLSKRRQILFLGNLKSAALKKFCKTECGTFNCPRGLQLPGHLSNYQCTNPQTCQCKESKFCYEPHGHVTTGDLMVIENARLREPVAKGPKYREPNRVNWKATEPMFLESIDLYAKKLVQKRTSRTQISL